MSCLDRRWSEGSHGTEVSGWPGRVQPPVAEAVQ